MAPLSPYHATLMSLLEKAPRKGEAHRWFFRIALHMRRYHKPEAVFKFLRAVADEHVVDRHVPDVEIRRSVEKAYAADLNEVRATLQIQFPEPTLALIDSVAAATTPLFDYTQPLDLRAGQVLPVLFRWWELICSGRDQGSAVVAPLKDCIVEVNACQFIVPSPMTALRGVTQQGTTSPRCLGNMGDRRYLIVEFDTLPKEQQARVLSHLALFRELVLVVDTAGKSLHGWFAVEGDSEVETAKFFTYACRLGADPHTWTKCQWVRMPGGTRCFEDGTRKLQAMVFVHDSVLKEAF